MKDTAREIREILDRQTTGGTLCEPLEGGRLRCTACGHRCVIAEGRRGVCQVRFNRNHELRVPYGYASGIQSDPVEKKPFFHVLPGTDALTFGMLGCDYHCSYCQNWITSQTLRDPNARAPMALVTPQAIVREAERQESRLIISSYNEPLITAEWARAIFAYSHEKETGLLCGMVSNGNATPEVLDYLQPVMDCYKVDLKSMQESSYRQLGGKLSAVLETIASVYERGIWIEVLTLIVPGFNDTDEELKSIASFIADVSPRIPWHVTAFHTDYRMQDRENTPPSTLLRACEIGKAEGLHHVYAGNLPGRVGDWEDTHCANCGQAVIRRTGYRLHEYRITADGKCPACSTRIPGIWTTSPETVRTEENLGRPWWDPRKRHR